jgi:CRISPR system Cascade subunit CasE
MTHEPLHLIRIPVDSRKLYEFARRNGLPSHELDEGYATHALLSALFDHGAQPQDRVSPKPFRLMDPTSRKIEVFGYARVDHSVLRERARAFADPLSWDVCDLEDMASRPVPFFEPGRKLGFSVRACPVRRVAKRGNQRQERAEVDVFLAKSWEVNDPSVKLDREGIYREWLAEQLERGGGARLLEASLKSHQREPMHRRTQGEHRKGRRVSHPSIVFEGVLEVLDSSAMHGTIARGLGRHRSFGFGMILLRPSARG